MPRLRPVRSSSTLAARPAPRMPKFVSAASGLVPAGPYLYVIGDDLKHLGVFRAGSRAPGSLVRLFAGTVPSKKKRRKKLKRDLESLAWLPPFAGFPHGALLALGSGSRRRRRSGALVALDAQQQVTGKPALIDLAALVCVRSSASSASSTSKARSSPARISRSCSAASRRSRAARACACGSRRCCGRSSRIGRRPPRRCTT